MVDCGFGINLSSTVAESGSFLVPPYLYSLWSFVGVRGESGYQ